MRNDIERAKAIYRKSEGSSFFMAREGVSDEYKSYKIARRIEYEWAKEFFLEVLEKTNRDDGAEVDDPFMKAIRILECIRAPTPFLFMLLQYLEENKDKFEAFGKIVYAEVLYESVQGFFSAFRFTMRSRRKARDLAVMLLKEAYSELSSFNESLDVSTISIKELKKGGGNAHPAVLMDRIERDMKQWKQKW